MRTKDQKQVSKEEIEAFEDSVSNDIETQFITSILELGCELETIKGVDGCIMIIEQARELYRNHIKELFRFGNYPQSFKCKNTEDGLSLDTENHCLLQCNECRDK